MINQRLQSKPETPLATKHRSWQWWALVLFCLWVAFLLRVYGLDFGLPYHFHPDEDQYVDVALQWYTEGRLEPRLINPPLFTYILTAAYGLWLAMSPFVSSPEWVTGAYFFARLWSVIFGVLTVALMYPIGKRLFNQTAGILGMVLLAGLFLPARESHFAVNDAPVTFFVLLAIYLSLSLLRHPRRSAYVLAGGAVGLATATKFMGGLVVFVLIAAHLFVSTQSVLSYKKLFDWRKHLQLGLSLLIAALIFFAITSFHIFWRFSQLVQILSWHLEAGGESYKGTRMAPATGWQFYIDVFGWGMGWLMLIIVVIVLGVVFFYRYRPGMILAIFPVALFLYMGAQKILFARYLLPAFPPLVILVAVGLAWLATRWLSLQQYQKVLWPLLVGLLLVQPLSYLIWFNYLLTLPDTRELASAWLMEEIPPHTIIAAEEYSILPGYVFISDNQWPYEIFSLNRGGPEPRNEMNHYLPRKAEIVALSNFTSGRIRQELAEEQLRREQLAFWNTEAVLIKTFNPYRNSGVEDWFYQDQIYGPAAETLQRVRPGPLINIYRVPYEKQPYSVEIPDIPIPVQANFGNKLMLLGYALNNRRAQPGGAFSITLYWQAVDRMHENYVIFNRLLDKQQQSWGGYDRLPQESSKTTLWLPNEVVVDTFDLPVVADAPNGIYTIDIGLYNQADPGATPLPLVFENHPIDQKSVRIGPVKVGQGPSDVVVSPTKIMPRNLLEVELGEPPVIFLHGFDLVPSGEMLQLTLYWENLSQTSADWTTFVHLKDETGVVVAQKDGPTGSGLYPTSLWDAGEAIVDQVLLPRPPELKQGKYTLTVGLYQLETGQRLFVPHTEDNSILLTTIDLSSQG